MGNSTPLISLKHVKKSFTNPEGQILTVLDIDHFQLFENEIVSILGKSGSGKSTLLRLVAGLSKPSGGTIHYQHEPVEGPVPGIAMVFQHFALLPWLTVLENVELGLEAQGMPAAQRRQRSLKTIDIIGLDGFESAYPKELSGGMRQRVGFARALVVEPELLIMDEPFSALDILTAENLRNDLIDLWCARRTRTKGILCVTHDIEEALLMSDRIVLFSSDPGRIQAEIKVDLPYPRDYHSPAFNRLMDKIYSIMTTSERERVRHAKAGLPLDEHPEYAYRLPDVSVSELTGLLEAMTEHESDGRIDLPELAESLHLDINNLFPLTEALDILRFAQITRGHLILLAAGQAFIDADILRRKQLFAEHLLKYIPLARHIREILDTNAQHRVAEEFFLQELEAFLSEEESERLLKIIIDWGRYAELFAYDYDAGILSLENPQ
jgi:NitT/TauT family transport system ATP-binding protein